MPGCLSKIQTLTFWCIFLCILFAPLSLFAQEEPETLEEDEVVVTAQKINESLDDPPVFVDIIEMDQFQGRFVTAQEAVQQAAGVTVRDFGGLGRLSSVSIRGSTSDQVVVLIDGVRLNPSTGGGADLSSIPADQIERIEIIRGGDSAFYGEGAVGGVINVITKKSKDKPRTTIGATYGSFNTFDSHAARSQGFDKGSYLVSANYLHSDGNFPFKSDNGTTLDENDDFTTLRKNNGVDDRNLLIKGNYSFTDQIDLAMQNDLHSSIKGVPGIITFPSNRAWQKELRNLTQANLSLAGLGADGLLFKTQLSNRYNHLEFSDRFGEQTGVPLTTKYDEYEPKIAQTIQYIWGTHQIWTLQAEYMKTLLKEGEENIYNDPDRDTWALALRDQVILWEDRISLVPAIRYDDISDMGSQWSPKFGASFRFVPWLVIKGNVGQSIRAPNFSELYFNQGFVTGNPKLKPEKAISYDAGLQVVTKPFFAEAAYFRSDVDDLIEYVLVSGFRYVPYNIGKAQLEGMEATGTFTPWKYTSLSGSFTMLYAIDKTDIVNREGNQIPGRPRYKGFARLEAGPSLLRAFAEYNYIGKNYITQANTKTTDERNLLNVGLVAHPSDQAHFGIEMKNVLDDQAVDVRGFPLPGRSVFATMEVSF